MTDMKKVPYLLLLFRLLCGPAMIALCYFPFDGLRATLGILITLGILSDIFDGIIARKTGTSSEKLRRMDSQTDLIFWVCAGWCAWLLEPALISSHKIPIITIFVMEALTYVISVAKFGKETCTHALLSKIWGITLFAAFIGIIGFGYAGATFYTMFAVGIIAHLDVYLIILLLRDWTHDVPSSWHALQLRKGKTIKRNDLFNG